MSLLSGKIGIVGATGVVGQELLTLFDEQKLDFAELRLLASARSAGRRLSCRGHDIEVIEASIEACADLDLVFLCVSAELAKEFAPALAKAGTVVVDNSSAFRMDPGVPLVIPEINAKAAAAHKGILANPNCSTIIMLMPLSALHDTWRARRIVVSTYQAASGAGLAAMEELENQTRDVLEGREAVPTAFKYPIAFNLFSHDSDVADNGYCGEENKMILETRKILEIDDIDVIPTTIRVPVLRAHSEAIMVEFDNEPNVEEARQLIEASVGVQLIDDRTANRFPMPSDASGVDDVFAGRLRLAVPGGKGLCLFSAGDQIRKGAALNALQIAQLL